MAHNNKYPSDFVEITTIPTDIRYATNNNFTGKQLKGYNQPTALLRTPAVNALLKANQLLKQQNLSLLILDAYRPQQAVNDMVQWAKNTNPSLLEENYIANRSIHSKGFAVDVTLIPTSKIGRPKELNMGSPFDSFEPQSHTNTPSIPAPSQQRRHILLKAMESCGFKNYEKEWWHFTYIKCQHGVVYYDFVVR